MRGLTDEVRSTYDTLWRSLSVITRKYGITSARKLNKVLQGCQRDRNHRMMMMSDAPSKG